MAQTSESWRVAQVFCATMLLPPVHQDVLKICTLNPSALAGDDDVYWIYFRSYLKKLEYKIIN